MSLFAPLINWLRRITPRQRAAEELEDLDREEFDVQQVLMQYRHRLAYIRDRRKQLKEAYPPGAIAAMRKFSEALGGPIDEKKAA